MRTLIFNGSARKNGDTQSLIEELTRQLEGEVRIINAHDCNVRACIDCRRCWEKPECSIQDDWQQIDPYQLRQCGHRFARLFLRNHGAGAQHPQPPAALLGGAQLPARKADRYP